MKQTVPGRHILVMGVIKGNQTEAEVKDKRLCRGLSAGVGRPVFCGALSVLRGSCCFPLIAEESCLVVALGR